MLIEHKTEKGTLTFFLPPSRADRFKYFYDEKPYLSYFIGSETFREYFLKGTVFIGLTSEVTEEQAKMMVDSRNGVKLMYKCYLTYDNISFTAKGSFKSLMQHLKVYEVDPYGKQPHLRDEDAGTVEETETRYFRRAAQQSTGKWVVLFKPND